MNTQNIDKLFKEAIKKSENFYSTEANKAKNSIWKELQTKNKINSYKLWFRISSVAVVLLLITASSFYFTLNKTTDSVNELIARNNKLQNELLIINQKHNNISSTINSTDTIFKIKKEIVYKTIEKIVHINDTIYIPQIYQAEKEESFANNSKSPEKIDKNNIRVNKKTEFIITKEDSNKKRKERNLKIRFGNQRKEINQQKTLVLSTRL